ncbi:hypothetical protein NXF25_006443, partial [Crotalus adamanteus]
PASDKLVILSDFSASVGTNSNNCNRVLGRHDVGKLNRNGLLLLRKCAEHNLCITDMMFRFTNKCKTTSLHLRSKHLTTMFPPK